MDIYICNLRICLHLPKIAYELQNFIWVWFLLTGFFWVSDSCKMLFVVEKFWILQRRWFCVFFFLFANCWYNFDLSMKHQWRTDDKVDFAGVSLTSSSDVSSFFFFVSIYFFLHIFPASGFSKQLSGIPSHRVACSVNVLFIFCINDLFFALIIYYFLWVLLSPVLISSFFSPTPIYIFNLVSFSSVFFLITFPLTRSNSNFHIVCFHVIIPF